MLEPWHPVAELRTAEAGAEAVATALVHVDFGDGAGPREVGEQLRIGERRRLVTRGGQQERGWIARERFAGRRAPGAVDARRVVGTRAHALDRVRGALVAGIGRRDGRAAEAAARRETDETDARGVEMPRGGVRADEAD